MKRYPNNKLFMGLVIQDQCPKQRRWRICAQEERKSPIIVPNFFVVSPEISVLTSSHQIWLYHVFHLTATCCTCGIPQDLGEEWAKTFYCCWSVAKSCPTLCDPMKQQASLAFTTSQSLLKLMSIESMMPSNHLILCCVI